MVYMMADTKLHFRCTQWLVCSWSIEWHWGAKWEAGVTVNLTLKELMVVQSICERQGLWANPRLLPQSYHRQADSHPFTYIFLRGLGPSHIVRAVRAYFPGGLGQRRSRALHSAFASRTDDSQMPHNLWADTVCLVHSSWWRGLAAACWLG